MKRPSFQFYPGDWLMDSSLRVITVGARGAWIDMLCLMHQAEPYGHLKVNGKVILLPNLARMIGATLTETEGYLAELEDAGVFSRDADGCVFSRRMIRDEELRQVRAAGGKLGGNPKLRGAPERLDGRLTSEVKQNPTPSSSSSSSSSKQTEEKPAPSRGTPQIGLQAWIDSLGDADAIPTTDPVFDYATKAGIPTEFLELSWQRFREDMIERGTKKRDWRAHYRNAVKGNWHKIWWFTPDGQCQLTTVGKQAQRVAA